MFIDTEQSAQLVNGTPEEERPGLIDEPTTPRDDDDLIPSSQQSLPSTEGANSPRQAGSPLQADQNDGLGESSIIPSSLTPPPSSQLPTIAGAGVVSSLGYISAHRTGIFSPPATGFNGIKRDSTDVSEFSMPTAQQVTEASTEQLRTMMHGCIAEHAKLKMEAAHHKLQFNLLTLQASEDSKRAAVEHEMTRREVEALRMAEHSRQARRDLSSVSESTQVKYMQLKVYYEQAIEESDILAKKFKAAKKVIQQKEDEVVRLTDDRELLLNRIRENREHFHHLCSPGGLFHGVMSPKAQAAATPQHRATPRQTPKSAAVNREPRDHKNENFSILLQALNSQENNSAPSTPVTGHRPAPRIPTKHTRNVQSMSSLPTTPIGRSRLDTGGLLPSVDLVPQTEPPYRHSRLVPETPPPAGRSRERRRSRESTISADDNEELVRQNNAELARQALQSFASRESQNSRTSSRRLTLSQQAGGEEVYESQASQAASEMLRRDPRESFEVASSVNSRDGTPVAPAADKSNKLQAKLFGGLNKSGVGTGGPEKRKFSGGSALGETRELRERIASPTKKLRAAGGLLDPGQVGLGIQYTQEA